MHGYTPPLQYSSTHPNPYFSHRNGAEIRSAAQAKKRQEQDEALSHERPEPTSTSDKDSEQAAAIDSEGHQASISSETADQRDSSETADQRDSSESSSSQTAGKGFRPKKGSIEMDDDDLKGHVRMKIVEAGHEYDIKLRDIAAENKIPLEKIRKAAGFLETIPDFDYVPKLAKHGSRSLRDRSLAYRMWQDNDPVESSIKRETTGNKGGTSFHAWGRYNRESGHRWRELPKEERERWKAIAQEEIKKGAATSAKDEVSQRVEDEDSHEDQDSHEDSDGNGDGNEDKKDEDAGTLDQNQFLSKKRRSWVHKFQTQIAEWAVLMEVCGYEVVTIAADIHKGRSHFFSGTSTGLKFLSTHMKDRDCWPSDLHKFAKMKQSESLGPIIRALKDHYLLDAVKEMINQSDESPEWMMRIRRSLAIRTNERAEKATKMKQEQKDKSPSPPTKVEEDDSTQLVEHMVGPTGDYIFRISINSEVRSTLALAETAANAATSDPPTSGTGTPTGSLSNPAPESNKRAHSDAADDEPRKKIKSTRTKSKSAKEMCKLTLRVVMNSFQVKVGYANSGKLQQQRRSLSADEFNNVLKRCGYQWVIPQNYKEKWDKWYKNYSNLRKEEAEEFYSALCENRFQIEKVPVVEGGEEVAGGD
ncbi:hypothetical protein BJ508DRAFT_314692 [Ascobolus immersus RN42]|uniref:Uncharacterized protein n=1 Tax=Ascobolus immersus RN42 TaxID=1160509 RepID=A0A3N4HE30_ASCIM|nr:hypothetical protein BJ508DRAFT_314692 [Ascobolus immersus RN42]